MADQFYTILYTASYNRRAAKFLRKHPELIDVYRKTLLLLERDPQHPSLRLYPLKGKLLGLYAVSINLSYRITLDLIINEKTVIPVMIGSHDEAYR